MGRAWYGEKDRGVRADTVDRQSRDDCLCSTAVAHERLLGRLGGAKEHAATTRRDGASANGREHDNCSREDGPTTKPPCPREHCVLPPDPPPHEPYAG